MALLVIPSDRLPLWRDDATIQFGRSGDVVLRDATMWQERALSHLAVGVDSDAVVNVARQCGTTTRAFWEFIERLGTAVARLDDLAPMHVLTADEVDSATVGVIIETLATLGYAAEWVTARGASPRVPALVVSYNLASPALCRELMSRDVAHTPIVLDRDVAEIGPRIEPGRTPCLACIDAHRRSDDPAWPTLAVQLMARATVPAPAALLVAASRVAAHLSDAADTSGDQIRVSAVAELERRRWFRHQECLCQSPQRNAMAALLDAPVRIDAASSVRSIASHA